MTPRYWWLTTDDGTLVCTGGYGGAFEILFLITEEKR